MKFLEASCVKRKSERKNIFLFDDYVSKAFWKTSNDFHRKKDIWGFWGFVHLWDWQMHGPRRCLSLLRLFLFTWIVIFPFERGKNFSVLHWSSTESRNVTWGKLCSHDDAENENLVSSHIHKKFNFTYERHWLFSYLIGNRSSSCSVIFHFSFGFESQAKRSYSLEQWCLLNYTWCSVRIEFVSITRRTEPIIYLNHEFSSLLVHTSVDIFSRKFPSQKSSKKKKIRLVSARKTHFERSCFINIQNMKEWNWKLSSAFHRNIIKRNEKAFH